MTFGEKLQQLRKKEGWTQEALAERITVSRQALSKWELGTAIPDTENVLQISKLFGVSIDYLLNDNYDSDEDLPAVHESNQKISNVYKGKIRSIIGACISVVALLGIVVLGIFGSVLDKVYVEAPSDVEWVRVYDGLVGFLKMCNLEWLFILCVIALIAGIVAIFYPTIMQICHRFKKKRNKKSESNYT